MLPRPTHAHGPLRPGRLAPAPRRHLLALAWVALGALNLLAACGSGVSGTGSGDAPLPDGNPLATATPVVLCNGSALAGQLCPASSASAPVEWVDVATGGRLRLQVQGDNATLRDDCRGRRFDGAWSRLSNGELAFVGSTLDDGAITRQPARLDLEAPSEGQLTATLRNEATQALMPATPMRRASTQDPAPSACVLP